MAQALDPIAYFYEGIWVHWSKGSLPGLTITFSPQNALFLTKTLLLLVTYCGSRFWSILRFIIHQACDFASYSGDHGLTSQISDDAQKYTKNFAKRATNNSFSLELSEIEHKDITHHNKSGHCYQHCLLHRSNVFRYNFRRRSNNPLKKPFLRQMEF